MPSAGDLLRFAGKVAVVTGAGGGLGREYALLFARRGASVVVNDLGGDRHGGGKGSKMADKVVQEITNAGGKAVPNYDSVTDGENIIKTAIDNFGRIDIVVNNAGILRDKSFAKMTDQDWDLINQVHLRGTYSVTKAAWNHMREQGYGRIIMVSSTSGVYGNFGQTNYGAVKNAVVGLANSLALEGKSKNINVNVVVPVAISRMTEDILPPEMHNVFKPHHVAPLVAWLGHEHCKDTGRVILAGGGWFGRLQLVQADGRVLAIGDDQATPEHVRDAWDSINDLEHAKPTISSTESTLAIMDKIEAGPTPPHPVSADAFDGKTNPDLCRGYEFEPSKVQVTPSDLMSYALGVGASTKDESDLRYLYEHHESFAALPSYPVTLALGAMGKLVTQGIPGVKIDLTKLLHGEEYLEVYRPIPTDAVLERRTRVVDLLDKGSGALMLTDVDILTPKGEKVAFVQMSNFLRGSGGFGGPRTSKHEKACVPVPSRKPDAVVEQRTSEDQAALYRLGGRDDNPLHIDPGFAAMAGFEKPILHGLCSLGHSVRHVVRQYGGNDAAVFKAVKCRFTKPVLPGQTLVTEMWRGDNNRIHFQTKLKETGDIVISQAYIDLHSTSDSGKASTKPTGATSALASDAVMQSMHDRLQKNPSIAPTVNAVFLWVITKGGKEAARWTADLSKTPGSVTKGDGATPGVTLTMDDEILLDLFAGKLNPQKAFMSGKLKLKGNIMLTQKLQALLKDQSKL